VKKADVKKTDMKAVENSGDKPGDKKSKEIYHLDTTSDDKANIERDEWFENDPVRDDKLPRRRLARERVLQVLYARAMNDRDVDDLFTELIASNLTDPPALEFARDLLLRLTSHQDETNALITERLTHWDFDRMALIDRLLIQIGITELRYFPEVPPKATINELIEIAKDYSTPESGKFINGILHAVMTHLLESGELNKTGRGLIDTSM
jgi:N utilization substance protein B